MKAVLLAFACVLVLGGCKSGLEDGEGEFGGFSEGNAGGKVQSNGFIFQSGRTRFDPSGGNQWIVELYSQAWAQPCAENFPPEYYVNFTLSKQVGTYPVTPQRPISFVRSITGEVHMAIATQGEIQIEKVENGYVIGRLLATYDENNHINGEFWAQICN